jgi:hypothetical protein
VDFYHEGSLVCWTDSGLEMIQCVSYNGTDTGTKVSSYSRLIIQLLVYSNPLIHYVGGLISISELSKQVVFAS